MFAVMEFLLFMSFGDRFGRGLAQGASPSEELFPAVTELFCLPSFGDIARVVGI
jgi:hypothetical protein